MPNEQDPHLARRVQLEKENSELMNQLDQLTCDVTTVQYESELKDTNIRALATRLSAKDLKIHKLGMAMARMQKENKSLKEEINVHTSNTASKEKEEKDSGKKESQRYYPSGTKT